MPLYKAERLGSKVEQPEGRKARACLDSYIFAKTAERTRYRSISAYQWTDLMKELTGESSGHGSPGPG